mgnify:CR=1 FL=1
MADQQVDPAQLAELVKGLSDEELKKQVSDLGEDEVLKNIFQGMQEAFIPEKAQGVNSTIQYDVDTVDEHRFRLGPHAPLSERTLDYRLLWLRDARPHHVVGVERL